MKTKLWLSFLLIGFAFAACEKDDEMRGRPDGAVKGRVIANLEESNCLIYGETPLIAGQHDTVGMVTVIYDDGNIIVTYETNPGWLITETHLHIAEEKKYFPVNNPGNPMIGNFQFGNDHYFKTVDGNKVIYTISWDDGCWYIAAHAVVEGVDYGENLEAFAHILPETVTLSVTNPTETDESYFNVQVSNGGILDGEWLGWCIQTQVAIVPGVLYEATVYSSYNMDNFDKVNWLINQNKVGEPSSCSDDYTYGDIQTAIWKLLGEELPPLGGTIISEVDECKVEELFDMANTYGEGFVPGCGQRIAIVLKPSVNGTLAQNIIIEIPVPCEYGEETAWGQGCLFTDRGNWAMYFKVCL